MKVCCGIFLTLAAIVHVVLTQSAVEYCVRPSQPALEAAFDGGSFFPAHRAFVESQCVENRTWNEYLAKQHHYFKSGVEFRFLSGVHFMNRSLEVNNASNLTLFGKGPSSVTVTTINMTVEQPTSLTFINFSHIRINGLRFSLCISTGHSILDFRSGNNLALMDADIYNTCEGNATFVENLKNVTITNTLIKGGIMFFDHNVGNIDVKKSKFIDSPFGYAFITYMPEVSTNVGLVVIDNCNFSCGNALKLELGSVSLILNNVYANGCQTSTLGFDVVGKSGYCNITNSEIMGYNYAILFTTNKTMILHVENCSLHNCDKSPFPLLGSALTLIGGPERNQSHKLTNVSFTGNGYFPTPELFTNGSSATAMISLAVVDISNCHFISNDGNALYVYQSHVYLFGHNYFGHNTGHQGAAMSLGRGAKIHLIHSIVTFEGNHADFTGGAIQIFGTDRKSPACPFAFPISSTLHFINNSAKNAGDVLYGGDLDQSMVNNTHCITLFKHHSHFEQPNNLSLISSQQSRVCLCNEKTPDCLIIFSVRRAYPGEELNLSVVAVGQNFGTTTGFIYAQLLQGREGSSLGQLQHFQLVHQHQCNLLPYTIYSRRGKEILVLTAAVKVVQVYGDNATVQANIDKYNEYNRSYVPKDLLQFPVYVNVTLQKCPPGFQLTDSPPYKCECTDRLQHLQGKYKVTCLINTQQVERSGTVWIGFDNNTNNGSEAEVIYSKYCPYHYCNPNKVKVKISYVNSQCQYNHSGRLCGQCSEGLSLTLGMSECLTCSNIYLLLIVPFAVGGIALVMFIKVTDFTVAVGLINGLIFYANIVKANDYIFFTGSSNTLSNIIQVIIAWLNLDLGIETCFFDGLDGYWKTWLQFLFPIYIWTIAMVMILLARYNMRMACILGNNSVPVLATLFTLSYAKLFRTIITAFHLTIIEYPHDHYRVVWSYDGKIEYWDKKHTTLFAVAVLVLLCLWLPYTSALLLGQCLQRCNILKIGALTARMKPFFDVHYGPFKDRHRYWFGVLLVARTIPLLVGAFTPLSSSTITPLSTIAVTGALLVYSFVVYKKWYVSLSEALFLLNLLFLSGSALYTASSSVAGQSWFTVVLVGIAIVHCVVIIIFNAMKHFLLKCTEKNDDLLLINSVHDYNDLSFRRDVPDT